MTRAVPPSVMEAIDKLGRLAVKYGWNEAPHRDADAVEAARTALLAAIADAIEAARPHDESFVSRDMYELATARAEAAEQRVAELERERDIFMRSNAALTSEKLADLAARNRLAAEVASAHGLLARAEAAEARVVELQRLVAKQAQDAGLWFIAERATEAYLQRALRRLHAAIEGKTPAQCVANLVAEPRP